MYMFVCVSVCICVSLCVRVCSCVYKHWLFTLSGDCLGMHKDLPFSTKDADHDLNGYSCSTRFHGAWWYSACYSSNLNGLYYQEGEDPVYATGVVWQTLTGFSQSLKTVTMKFTPG